MKVKHRWLVPASLVAVAAAAAALVSASTGGASAREGLRLDHRLGRRRPTAGGEAVREDASERQVNIVTYDGDGNGATTMQTKIQLWNRTGKGWPDVIFSEQANDPVWMAQKPFDFAMNLKGVFPANAPQELALAVARAVHGQRPAGLPPGQPRPGGALRQQEADDPVRLHGPDDVAAVGGSRHAGRGAAPRVHHRERRRFVRRLALPLGRQVPDLAGRRDEHREDQRERRALHAHGAACSTR